MYKRQSDAAVNAAVLLHIRPCCGVYLLYLHIDAGCFCLLLERSSNRYITLVLCIYGYTKVNSIREACLS